jgi:hypothetical protein
MNVYFYVTFTVNDLIYFTKVMSEIEQQQEEEREVLLSIYDGDPAFKHLPPVTFQYKVDAFRLEMIIIYLGEIIMVSS